ncbi:MAG: histone deacetylase family protein [Candidatus Protistobacter heckmanni]|nr:histone deacetylase family protein [Candidatus Protistobacter heckmanni]
MTTGYYSHPDCLLHEMGPHHPECSERLEAMEDQLILARIDGFLRRMEAPLATEEDLLLVHSRSHVDYVREHAPQSGYYAIDADTTMNSATWRAALRSAGGAVAAVDAVMRGDLDNAFCAARPPGHHAEPDRAMGFCFFNNVAIAAHHAVERHGLQRVVVIDFDVHHGNGTEAAFRDDPNVLMCSFFQHPFYPYSGADAPAQNMINLPMPAYTTGLQVREAIDMLWLPRLHAFQPELLVISAGFDAHREDDLGQMGLVEADYAWITGQLMDIAKRYAQGRIVSCLEGGYNLSALARSVVAHLRVLADI